MKNDKTLREEERETHENDKTLGEREMVAHENGETGYGSGNDEILGEGGKEDTQTGKWEGETNDAQYGETG